MQQSILKGSLSAQNYLVHSKVQSVVTMKNHSATLQIDASHELCIMYQSTGLFRSIFYPYRGMEGKFPGVCQEHFPKESRTKIIFLRGQRKFSKGVIPVKTSFPRGLYLETWLPKSHFWHCHTFWNSRTKSE